LAASFSPPKWNYLARSVAVTGIASSNATIKAEDSMLAMLAAFTASSCWSVYLASAHEGLLCDVKMDTLERSRSRLKME
jgi:hypothetical protein